MKPLRKRIVLVVSSTAIAGVALSACFTANLSGSASVPSPIVPLVAGPTATKAKRLEFNLSTKDSFGTGLGGAGGSLKDAGTNPFFPRGVKISFRNGLAMGVGIDCSDESGGPSRRPHSGAATQGVIADTDLCAAYEDPRAWFGLVTYSSADPRYYSNEGFAECSDYYRYFIEEFAGVFPWSIPASAQLAKGALRTSSRSTENISGFGVAVVIDTNLSRNYDHGDRFAFVPVCGPYTHLPYEGFAPSARSVDVSAQLAGADLPAPLRAALSNRTSSAPNPLCAASTACSDDAYNYIACHGGEELDGFYLAGAIASAVIDDDIDVPFQIAMICAGYQPGTSGDLKIGIATQYATTTTTTLAP